MKTFPTTSTLSHNLVCTAFPLVFVFVSVDGIQHYVLKPNGPSAGQKQDEAGESGKPVAEVFAFVKPVEGHTDSW